MCRWLAYFGSPVRPEWLLYRTGHGLIDQSLAAREMDHPINGDGFGMGWYGTAQSPDLYRNVAPAWSDRNLHEVPPGTALIIQPGDDDELPFRPRAPAISR